VSQGVIVVLEAMASPRETRIVSYGSTSIGRVRSTNEDAFLRDDHIRLYAVADGVGGQPAGEIASELAVKELQRFFRFYVPAAERSVPTMNLALRAVNDAVQARARSDVRCRGMATTLTACWIIDHRAIIGHVGDSQAFLLRGGRIRQVTVEHTVASELRGRGVGTHHPVMRTVLSHMLTKSVGPEPLRDPQVCDIELKRGDILMLCSDGVTRNTTEHELARIMREQQLPQQAVEELLRVADEHGGQDNATAVIVKIL